MFDFSANDRCTQNDESSPGSIHIRMLRPHRIPDTHPSTARGSSISTSISTTGPNGNTSEEKTANVSLLTVSPSKPNSGDFLSGLDHIRPPRPDTDQLVAAVRMRRRCASVRKISERRARELLASPPGGTRTRNPIEAARFSQ